MFLVISCLLTHCFCEPRLLFCSKLKEDFNYSHLPLEPVNNLQDAYDIAIENGFDTIYVLEDHTITAGIPNLDDFTFIGRGRDRTTLTLDPAASIVRATFYDMSILGTLDGQNRLRGCRITTLAFVDGDIELCELSAGTITLSGASEAHFIDCWSGIPGASTPIIDMNGSGTGLAMRRYAGGITISNKSGLDNVSIDLTSGVCILAASVTAGSIVVRGVGNLTDNSAGATVIKVGLVSPENIRQAVWAIDSAPSWP